MTSDELTAELATVEIGSYYYGACLSIPSEPTALCSTGLKLTIKADIGTPDLIFGGPTVDRDIVLTGIPTPIVFTVALANGGDAPSASTAPTVTFYRSTNEDLNVVADRTALTEPAPAPLSPSILNAGERANVGAIITVNEPAEKMIYYGVCLSRPESTTFCSATVLVTVKVRVANVTLPDTAPTLAWSTVTANTPTSIAIVFRYVLTNKGEAPSSATGVEVTFYRSTNEDLNVVADRTALTTPAVALIPSISIGLGATYTLPSIGETINIDLDAGTYHYGACLSGPGTTPSCTKTATLVVAEPMANVTLPDTALTLSRIRVPVNTPTSVRIGLRSVLTNEGDAPSSATGVEVTFYRSTTSGIDIATDAVVGTAVAVTEAIDPEGTYTLPSGISTTINETTTKIYYYGACLSGPGTTPSCTKTQALVAQ